MNPLLPTGCALLVSAVAAVTDHRAGRIPNWLTVSAGLTGLLLHVMSGRGAAAEGALGCILAGGVPWLLHRSTRGRAIGGGDVKLFAALGALTGPSMGLEIELSAFLLLTVFALVRLAFAGRLLRVLLGSVLLLIGPVLPARWRRQAAPDAFTEMRLGPAIAVAVLTVLLKQHLVAWMPWLG